MPRLMYVLLLYFVLALNQWGWAANISLSIKNVELVELLKILAQAMQKKILISDKVQGKITLEVSNLPPENLLSFLLKSRNLVKIQTGALWYITTRTEAIAQNELAVKYQASLRLTEPLEFKTWHLKYASVKKLSLVLKDGKIPLLSERGNFNIDIRSNSISVFDTISSINKLEALIHQLDVAVPQILIRVRIVAIDNNFVRDLGFTFESKTIYPVLDHTKNTSSEKFNLTLAKLAEGALLDVKLTALENLGHAELISSPSLFAENLQAASIEAGEEIPYQEVSEGGGTATMFKRAVLALKVTPQVLPKKMVLMQLQINQDRPSTKFILGVPSISTRQLITQVMIRAGETVVLGGIYESNREQMQQGIPFLSNLPVFRNFLAQNTVRRNKRQLLIFVTPVIINTYENRT